MTDIQEYLIIVNNMMSPHRNEDLIHATIEGLVLEHGQTFDPSPRPPDVAKDTIKECFSNALTLALTLPGWVYCEGYATATIPVPVLHGWCLNADGVVVDPTWDEGTGYYGIPLDPLKALTYCAGQGRWGILPNDWMNDTVLLRTDAITDLLPATDLKGQSNHG